MRPREGYICTSLSGLHQVQTNPASYKKRKRGDHKDQKFKKKNRRFSHWSRDRNSVLILNFISFIFFLTWQVDILIVLRTFFWLQLVHGTVCNIQNIRHHKPVYVMKCSEYCLHSLSGKQFRLYFTIIAIYYQGNNSKRRQS